MTDAERELQVKRDWLKAEIRRLKRRKHTPALEYQILNLRDDLRLVEKKLWLLKDMERRITHG